MPPQTDDPLLRELRAAPRSSEALALALELPLGRVLAQLTELEVEGQVACDNGFWSVVSR
jgi:DNA processing protein